MLRLKKIPGVTSYRNQEQEKMFWHTLNISIYSSVNLNKFEISKFYTIKLQRYRD